MAQNLIRVKQLNTSELSGFVSDTIASTGTLYDVFVSKVADQTISGVKTFTSRPTVNGTGVLLSGEAAVLPTKIVYTSGDQYISGVKTFEEISCLKNATLSGDVINKNYADQTLSNNTNLDFSFPTGLTGIRKINYTLRQPSGFGWGVNYNSITWLTSAPSNPTFTDPVVFEYYPSGPNSTQSYGIYINALANLEKNRHSTIVYNTGDQTISGNKNFISLPKVNNTGVLLSGQNSFIINLYNTSDIQSAGHNYFGNIAAGFSATAGGVNRRFPVLEACVVRRATWAQNNGTVGSPSLNSTGYFINTTTSTTGIISTTINTQSTSTPTHYIAEFSPPIVISTGDYIVCNLFGPTYATTFPATVRNSVNLYCYN